MILMLAPAPGLNLGAMPSGAAYVSDAYGLVKIVNDSAADQAGLTAIGCFTLTPFGGWGNFGFNTLADLYAADTGAILPGITGFPEFTVASVFADSTAANIGTWAKTGVGNGEGYWTRVSVLTLVSLAAQVAAIGPTLTSLQAQITAVQGEVAAISSTLHLAAGGPVLAATTAALPSNTYANGTAGVGATLTATANGALPAQDGVTLANGARLLVKNEASAAHNGLYVVTQLGGSGAPYILTRATDANTAAELSGLSVMMSGGSILAGQLFVLAEPTTLTIGTTALPFIEAEFSFQGGIVGVQLLGAATPQAAMASIGSSRIVGLETFAAPLGIDLTVARVDIQAAVDAAYTAMVNAYTAGAGAGLKVMIPAGDYTLLSPTLTSRGGFFCQPGSVILRQRAGSTTPFVQLDSPYATDFLFDGFKLDGGWSYGAAPYASNPESDPALFQYLSNWPNTSPVVVGGVSYPAVWYPDHGAVTVGQAAVYIISQFAGIDDAAYEADSVLGSQEPRGRISNLEISNFGGDGVYLEGNGLNTVQNIHINNVGGRSFCLNSYDGMYIGIDCGPSGLEGLLCYGNGANFRMMPMKAWFNGFRGIAGHMAGVHLYENGGAIINGEIQDSYGPLVQLYNAGDNTFIGTIDWQGGPEPQAYDLAAFDVTGNCQHNKFIVKCSVDRTTSPDVQKIVRLTKSGGYWPSDNHFDIRASGFENDNGVYTDEWVEFVGTGYDPSGTPNYIEINGSQCMPREFIAPYGQRSFWGMLGNNYAVGLGVNGPNSQYPALQLVAGFGQGSLVYADDTTAKAAGVLTATANFHDGDRIVIGTKTMVMRAALATPGADGDVQIGSTLALSLANLANAVDVYNYVAGARNNLGVRGTDYSWRTTRIASVVAAAGATTLTVTAAYGGAAGNAIATTAASSVASWGAATLTGGAQNAGIVNTNAVAWGATAATIAVVSASYNATTGLVTLTLASPVNLAYGGPFTVSGLTGTGAYAAANGAFTAAGSGGSTLSYTIATGLTLTFTSATGAVAYNPGTLGFYGASLVAKPNVTGAKGGNAALASLMSALAALGLVTDSTT
jgi:hypothetical protein